MIVQSRTLGQAFKRRRLTLGLTQADIARRIGTTQSYIAAVERGDRETRWSTVLEIARALELEPMLVPRERLPAVEAVLRLSPEATCLRSPASVGSGASAHEPRGPLE